MRIGYLLAGTAMMLAACGGHQEAEPVAEPDAAPGPAPVEASRPNVAQLELHKLDCGTIEISDLDAFSAAGDYAGLTDTFTNTCWLVRHPEGDLLWDTGLPGMLAGMPAQEQDVFTVSLDRSLTGVLRERGIEPGEIEYVAISHSHFDHIGQIDQFDGSLWLVHQDEYDAMFPSGLDTGDSEEAATQFGSFARFSREIFTGERDVFGDGSVLIVPAPGHTPGHTILQVDLPETGTVLLSGDLYHRTESRQLRRVPVFNSSLDQTRASMAAFEQRAAELNATVIIQHEPDSVDPLPDVLR